MVLSNYVEPTRNIVMITLVHATDVVLPYRDNIYCSQFIISMFQQAFELYQDTAYPFIKLVRLDSNLIYLPGALYKIIMLGSKPH